MSGKASFSWPHAMVTAALVLLTGCSGRSTHPAKGSLSPGQESVKVAVDWNAVLRVSNTKATLQVVVSPVMSRTSPIHDKIFDALRNLHCDDVRYVPWLPYPKLAVAELEPPSNGKTSWNFSLIDPFAEDFAQATAGHSTIWNFSTIPQWMWKTAKPVPYPSNPDQVTWTYEQGTELVDPSMKQVADYYGRLVSWYTKGGFKDEYGHEHQSGHHYKIDYWEILNEVDFEHRMTPEFYTRIYDAIAAAIHQAEPNIKFVGLALAEPSLEPHFFEYFLNHKHHKPGIPLDMISYHFYASPPSDENPEAWQYTFFEQADRFLATVRYIQAIRERLSPGTGTTVDEVGAILPDFKVTPPRPVPKYYWNLCAALYAYLYGRLSSLGVQGVGESALAQVPGNFPYVTMIDWRSGQPNARYWVLKLIHDQLGPGDKLVGSNANVPSIYAQAFIGRDGTRKILLVNERERPIQVSISGIAGGQEQFVDETTGDKPPGAATLNSNELSLGRLGVAVIAVRP